MLYTWVPVDPELIFSSYINHIQLVSDSNQEPDIEVFRNMLMHKLESSISSICDYKDEMHNSLNTESIAYINEMKYSQAFMNRVLRNFPHGWELLVDS